MTSQHSPFYWMLQSRKAWATLIGLILMIVMAVINHQTIDPNTLVNSIMILVGIYVSSIAIEDGLTQRDAGRTKVDTPATGGDVTVTTTAAPAAIVIPPAPPHVGLTGLK